MIVNDTAYGGCGGSPAIVSVNRYSSEIMIHELGHTLAGLGDEYPDPAPGYPDVEEPNTSRTTKRDSIQWRSWILESTPLPTPPTSAYGTVVGLFEGAHYHATGWYRPKLNCKMRGLGQPFCDVCTETLVKSIYSWVRPIESFSPAASVLTIADTQAIQFSVKTALPTPQSMRLQWLVDGGPQNGTGAAVLGVSGRARCWF